jgi:hypothetical protein
MAALAYHSTFVRISRDTILKVAGLYNATSYWQQRLAIEEHMKKVLDLELTKAYCTCEGIQLLKIDMPKPYEESIVSTQVEVQKTSMRKFEQIAELIRQNISVIRSEADQKIRVTNATGTAEAFRVKQYAEATALNKTINTESKIYKKVEKDLVLSDKELTQYLFLTALNDQRNAKLLVGLQNSIISFGNTPVSTSRNNR